MPKVVPEYKEQARERILRAAQQVFSEKGYHEARMDDIAVSLGVSKRTLYLYYKNKEDLFEAMCAGVPQTMKEMLQACLKNGDFKEACMDFFDASTEGPVTGLNFEIIAAASRNKALKEIERGLYESEIEVLSQFLKDMKKKGSLPVDFDAPRVARALIALYDGLMAELVLGVRKSEARLAWAEATNRIMNTASR
jgi:AcrR family transcriptional regulator